jgi:hypothetical protein
VCVCVCDVTYPISMESTRVMWGGGGYRVNIVTLHYDEVSSSMKIKKLMSSNMQCE